MAELHKLKSKSKVAQISTTANEMTALYGELNLSGDLFLKSLFDEYTPLSVRMSAAIKRDQAESDLDERDGGRDSTIRDIFYVVKGASRTPIESIKMAGEKILVILDKYTLDMIRESYSIESAHIHSMLNDLSTEEMIALIGEIAGLEQLLNQLKQEQEEFESAQSALDDALSSAKETASATDIKKEIISLVNEKLVVYLRAMNLANPEMYGDFVRRTAEIIHRNNQQVKRRNN